MQLFYQEDINNVQHILDERESKHIIRVLRMKLGSEIWLTNGRGDLYRAEIAEVNPKACLLLITERIEQYKKRAYHLHMIIAPTKNIERFEWFIEKATEIGIDEITPVRTKYSERKIIKPERLEKVLVSAMKQSHQAYKPVLNRMVDFSTFITGQFHTGAAFIAHCVPQEKKLLKNACLPKQDTTILIGPEGDFAESEIEKAINAGFDPVSLGESRLRTETAGIVACHTIALANQK